MNKESEMRKDLVVSVDLPDDTGRMKITGKNWAGLQTTNMPGTLKIPDEGVRNVPGMAPYEQDDIEAQEEMPVSKTTKTRSRKTKPKAKTETQPPQDQQINVVKVNISIPKVTTFPTQYTMVCKGKGVCVLGILPNGVSWVPECSEYVSETDSYTNVFGISGLEGLYVWGGHEFTMTGQRYIIVLPHKEA